MAKVRHFEDLVCWQKARLLANGIYALTSKGSFNKDFKLRDQILGTAGSTMHNIAEGCDSGSDVEFIRFLKFARCSSSEVQSELYLALDRGYISSEELQHAYDLAEEVKRIINGLISYLRKGKKENQVAIGEAEAVYLADDLSDLPVDHSQESENKKSSGEEINFYRPTDYDSGN